MSFFRPPHPPYDPTDTTGFSYETVLRRWPVILTSVIDHVHRTNHDISIKAESHCEERLEDGKRIISLISKLKYEMARDRKLEPIPDDGEADVVTYNVELEELAKLGKDTWFTAPWLYAECYLYRLLRAWFSLTTYWHHHDPFFYSKENSFKGSHVAIFQLASVMRDLEKRIDELKSDHEEIGIVFKEMIQMSLWGNATDLSLLTNMTHEDIQKLQSVGKDAHEERKQYILHDDAQDTWDHLRKLSGGRVDFVLDNAGFELFTDLVFADFFVTCTPFVSKVVFHPKSIPWFVSDVTPPDFNAIFTALLSPSFFEEESEDLVHMVKRWRSYVDGGVFSLSVPLDTKIGASDPLIDFWTSPYPYWDMKIRAPGLFNNLQGSDLVVFKGDLNYRKLAGDIQWPVSTPFEDAIGPLAGAFPILSLRTAKADVVVGVDQAKADELDKLGEKWRVSGKYAMISFVRRTT